MNKTEESSEIKCKRLSAMASDHLYDKTYCIPSSLELEAN